ncbi:MAG TPA: hypothetical protein VN025_19610 [Candidatus Dormibacteraeota bacterium]|jgi:hypothetical protein|nr:hypothetical protein [Candidatus Dormibacteraeota bacterium]
MNKHTYLRAYMAGIMVPTPFLLVVVTVFCIVRYVYNIPIPIERVIIFPMAVVPNVWGLWNVLYIALHSRYNIPIGAHGAILPLLFAPVGYLVARILEFPFPGFVLHVLPIGLPVGIIVYYLAWKHLVGFLNGVLGIA